MDEVKRITSVRAAHKSYVTKIIEEFNAGTGDKDRTKRILLAKRELLAKLTDDLVANLTEETKIQDEISKHITYEEKIDNCLAKLDNASRTSQPARVRLPEIQIKSFSGSASNWMGF